MRNSDIEMVCEVIRSSGIGTKIQRQAMMQRIRDWNDNLIHKRKQAGLTPASNIDPTAGLNPKFNWDKNDV